MTRTRRLSGVFITLPWCHSSALRASNEQLSERLDAPQQLGQRNIQTPREMAKRGERGSDTARFHLPDVLPLEVDDAFRARSKLEASTALPPMDAPTSAT